MLIPVQELVLSVAKLQRVARQVLKEPALKGLAREQLRDAVDQLDEWLKETQP